MPPTNYGRNYKAANPLPCFSACADGSAFDPGSITIVGYNYQNSIINALSNGQVVIVWIKTNIHFRLYRCGVLTTTPPASYEQPGHGVTIVDY